LFLKDILPFPWHDNYVIQMEAKSFSVRD